MFLYTAFLKSEAVYTLLHDLSCNRDNILPVLCSHVAQFRHQCALIFWGEDEEVDAGEFDIDDVRFSNKPLEKAFALAGPLDEAICKAVNRIVEDQQKLTLKDFEKSVGYQRMWISQRIETLDRAEVEKPYICLRCGMTYNVEPDVCSICEGGALPVDGVFQGLTIPYLHTIFILYGYCMIILYGSGGRVQRGTRQAPTLIRQITPRPESRTGPCPNRKTKADGMDTADAFSSFRTHTSIPEREHD